MELRVAENFCHASARSTFQVPNAVTTLQKTTSAAETSSQQDAPILEAQGLHRLIRNIQAVSDISLSLHKGDVLGLLGLNGAGKSTTLKLLCGILVPDKGSISINQHDLSEAPIQARSHIGYLPDHPPLYDDMRVNEYLLLCGKLHALTGSTLRDRLSEVIQQCNLLDVEKKLIGGLSKGFRQRVGLAQAMIHQPAVLLLDEPSNGLDPQQLDDMQQLIHEYAHEHAVVLSTHLLAEAQATCNRVAIIHKGKIVCDTKVKDTDLESLFHGTIS